MSEDGFTACCAADSAFSAFARVTSSSIQSGTGLLKVPPEAFTVTGSQRQNKAHRHCSTHLREREGGREMHAAKSPIRQQ